MMISIIYVTTAWHIVFFFEKIQKYCISISHHGHQENTGEISVNMNTWVQIQIRFLTAYSTQQWLYRCQTKITNIIIVIITIQSINRLLRLAYDNSGEGILNPNPSQGGEHLGLEHGVYYTYQLYIKLEQ